MQGNIPTYLAASYNDFYNPSTLQLLTQIDFTRLARQQFLPLGASVDQETARCPICIVIIYRIDCDDVSHVAILRGRPPCYPPLRGSRSRFGRTSYRECEYDRCQNLQAQANFPRALTSSTSPMGPSSSYAGSYTNSLGALEDLPTDSS